MAKGKPPGRFKQAIKAVRTPADCLIAGYRASSKQPAGSCASSGGLRCGIGSLCRGCRTKTQGLAICWRTWIPNPHSRWLGHSEIKTILIYLELVPDPTGSLAPVQ